MDANGKSTSRWVCRWAHPPGLQFRRSECGRPALGARPACQRFILPNSIQFAHAGPRPLRRPLPSCLCGMSRSVGPNRNTSLDQLQAWQGFLCLFRQGLRRTIFWANVGGFRPPGWRRSTTTGPAVCVFCSAGIASFWRRVSISPVPGFMIGNTVRHDARARRESRIGGAKNPTLSFLPRILRLWVPLRMTGGSCPSFLPGAAVNRQ